jgi:hypothetical protein
MYDTKSSVNQVVREMGKAPVDHLRVRINWKECVSLMLGFHESQQTVLTVN